MKTINLELTIEQTNDILSALKNLEEFEIDMPQLYVLQALIATIEIQVAKL